MYGISTNDLKNGMASTENTKCRRMLYFVFRDNTGIDHRTVAKIFRPIISSASRSNVANAKHFMDKALKNEAITDQLELIWDKVQAIYIKATRS